MLNIFKKGIVVAEAAKKSRKNPEIQMEMSERLREVVAKSGLDTSVISFRCGWGKGTSRLNNYMSGHRSIGGEELRALDMALYQTFGKLVSTYIMHGDKYNDADDSQFTEADYNRAFRSLIDDYMEMNRLILEPKLTPSKMLDDLTSHYLKRGGEEG